MKQILLGNSQITISAMGLGVMPMSSGFYDDSHADETDAIRTIRLALDHGVNFFDTADFYGQGHNERLLGKALKGRRREAVIATKFGFKKTDEPPGIAIDGRPEYIRQACEQSLRRLDVETIDLYYQHRRDPSVPIEESVGAMVELIDKGYIRSIGLCEVSDKTLKRAQRVYPVAALQTEYSLWSRDVEADILPACLECNTTFVAYSPLGRGFLTNKAPRPDQLSRNDYRRTQPRFQATHYQRNREIVVQLEALAKDKGCSTAQLALAWILSRGNHIVPIPGTRRSDHLLSNVDSFNLNLSPNEIKQIETITAGVSGERYGPLGLSWTRM